MKPRRLSIVFLITSLLVASISGVQAKKKKRGPKTKLQGEYLYLNEMDKTELGNLEAVFTPDGENRWTVRFFVMYGDQLGDYEGTAQGSLTDGPLSGEVRGDFVGQSFEFRGAFEQGVFRGTHRSVTAKTATDTGTLILYPKGMSGKKPSVNPGQGP